jgi:DNA polymerase III delta prime subunit
MEEKNRKFFDENPTYVLPYPHLDDRQFQKKITLKKEFQYRYDGEIDNVSRKSEIVCKKKSRELFPHQEFIKRYISNDTPYNGMLLYHGLGSGKTCSAIGVTEALRTYSKYIQGFKKIMIVASPNVQENFKLQLFNPSSLKKENGIWNISGCLGNSFIEELNISQINDLEKEVLIQKINKIISNHYIFLGYVELANIIEKLYRMKHKEKVLRNYFEGRVIVIDEIHNIRLTSDSDKAKKKVATMLKSLVQIVKQIRFIFLTGTPMYNDPKEIIFILNILNANDNRSTLTIGEVFDANGELKVRDGIEIGKQKLILKANGYVSYVRGENPYAFPFLVTPKMYKDPHSIKALRKYPERQFNNNRITKGIQHLDLYLHKMSEMQEEGYDAFIDQITSELSEEELERFEEMDSVQYTMVMKPIQALNINYKIRSKEGDNYYVGKEGLKQVMRFRESANPPSKNNFEYKINPGMFQHDKIGQYSVKIKSILDHIIHSTGIVLVYSQYIDGGLVPMALALEELGMKRYSNKNLFKTPPNEPLNVYNMRRDPSLFTGDTFKQASYAIICGDKKLSPNNKEEVEALTHHNMNGERVKVVLISQAGSEGIDLNYLRQVHIMEPWYNMNRIEQIIGRARRNCSHKDLELKDRNVQLFLHATLLDRVESMDMFLYRKSEIKSIKIGKVSKLLKSVAVDCILNKEQQSFSKMTEVVKIELSDKNEIDFEVKDQPFTSLCDYSDTCDFECINKAGSITDKTTYTYESAKNSKIVDRIKELFTIKHVYHAEELSTLLKPGIETERAFYNMINDRVILIDKFGRKGYLININNLYLFQPIEIKDKRVTMYERMNPITYKPKMIELEMNNENVSVNENENASSNKSGAMDKFIKLYKKAKAASNEEDWYDYYYESFKLVKSRVTEEDKEQMLVTHICETFTFEEELEMIQLFLNDSENDVIEQIKEYYQQFVVQVDELTGILLLNYTLKEPLQIYVSDGRQWTLATYEERGILSKEIRKKLTMDESMFKWIGYMGNYKGSFDFKIINTESAKLTSSVFENKGRAEMYKILNETSESFVYNTTTADVKKIQLAIVEELYLRIYDTENEDRYFLNKLEIYILNKKLR